MLPASLIGRAALPHLILYGAKRTGKTTFARALANERGVRLVETTGDTLLDQEDVQKLLWMRCANGWTDVPGHGWLPHEPTADEPVILFVDEVHRVAKEAAESLYHPLEDSTTRIETDSGLSQVRLPPFTMVGATTDAGELLQSLAARVRMLYLDPYRGDELTEIARAHAVRLTHEVDLSADQMIPERITWDDGALREIATRSQGTLRVIVGEQPGRVCAVDAFEGCLSVPPTRAQLRQQPRGKPHAPFLVAFADHGGDAFPELVVHPHRERLGQPQPRVEQDQDEQPVAQARERVRVYGCQERGDTLLSQLGQEPRALADLVDACHRVVVGVASLAKPVVEAAHMVADVVTPTCTGASPPCPCEEPAHVCVGHGLRALVTEGVGGVAAEGLEHVPVLRDGAGAEVL